ncbi:MAG: hypothetical protein AUJ47_12975 [Candidatus Marinimicrobia bacterium CG1_02_48_14]|nr:MAG: hypothetical protein AUJ47_12975 [Candidatus Marinimicrobia bacterium CG1_02_48_14]
MISRHSDWTSFTLSVLAASTLLLMTCASEGALSGGPADKTAPTVVFSSPKPAATRVPVSTEVKLTFSEKMLPATVRSALRIVPEPVDGYDIKTTWRKLEIRFNSPLRQNQTYLVTLDKSATDLRQNGLDGTFILAFSTGDKLDNGVLAGLIVGSSDVQKKGKLLLYENTNQELDSLRATKSEYTFQPTDTGTFKLPYLVERAYVLFYHWDQNQNGLIDAGDFFGRPASSTVYPQADSASSQIRIRPQIVPPKQLKLLSAKKLESSLLRLRLTRPVAKITKRTDLNVLINGQPMDLLGIAPVKDDAYGLVIHTAAPGMPGENALHIRDFMDTTGVILSSDTLLIQAPMRRDSVALNLLSVSFSGGNAVVVPDKNTTLTVQFSKPIIQSAENFLTIHAIGPDTLEVPGKLSYENTTQVIFTPDSLLPARPKLAWRIDSKPIHGWWGETLPDSVYAGVLKMISPDSLGRLIINQNSGRPLMLVLTGTKFYREQRCLSDSATILAGLPSGSYHLWAYEDLNANGKYDNGGFNIHESAEPFWEFPDEISIRARWDYDVGLWDFSGY